MTWWEDTPSYLVGPNQMEQSLKFMNGKRAEGEPDVDLARTPAPPYYAVIFTSSRNDGDCGYNEMSDEMTALAERQPGFLGMESVRDDSGFGITVSYWESEEAIAAWKQHHRHRAAQQRGMREWYKRFAVRVCRVERESGSL